MILLKEIGLILMKKTKIPTDLAKNASKLHKRVLELLVSKESIFKHYSIRQEVPVKNINPTYKTFREKIDICILELNVCIEIHGKQHYEFVCFGGIDSDTAKRNFRDQQERDYLKQKAVEEAGWGYFTISYKEAKLTLEEITNRIIDAIDSSLMPIIEKSPSPKQKIKSNNKLQSRGFQKKPEGYKYQWAKKHKSI